MMFSTHMARSLSRVASSRDFRLIPKTDQNFRREKKKRAQKHQQKCILFNFLTHAFPQLFTNNPTMSHAAFIEALKSWSLGMAISIPTISILQGALLLYGT